jgi:hypothetical protein
VADMTSSTPVESLPNEDGISPGTAQQTQDRSHSAPESAVSDRSLSIRRTLGAVVVKVAGKVSEAVTLTLEHVL